MRTLALISLVVLSALGASLLQLHSNMGEVRDGILKLAHTIEETLMAEEDPNCATFTKVVNGTTISRTYCKEPDETEAAFGARAAMLFQEFCDGIGG